MIADTKEKIHFMRLATLKAGLSLECKGMRHSRGVSCYAIVKQEFGFKGNKESVLSQLQAHIDAIKSGATISTNL